MNRRGPHSQKRQIQWDPNTDGIFRSSLAQSLAYTGRVNYFEYDHYEEEVQGQQIQKIALIDLHRLQIILKETFDLQAYDKKEWGINPMAVGTLNRVPATAAPSYLIRICNQPQGAISDQNIRNKLIKDLPRQSCARILQAISPQKQ